MLPVQEDPERLPRREECRIRQSSAHHTFSCSTAHMAGLVQQKIVGNDLYRTEGFGRGSGALYATAHDVDAALAEPAYGPVQLQSNGARIRTTSRATETSTTPGVVSAYRNLFISSYSGYKPGPRVPIVVQWRIHRAIEAAFSALS